MRPDGTDWIGIEARGIYDGISVYAYADGRIVNRWDNDDWRGSTRWQATEDYIEASREWIESLVAAQFPPSGAERDDQQGDAGALR